MDLFNYILHFINATITQFYSHHVFSFLLLSLLFLPLLLGILFLYIFELLSILFALVLNTTILLLLLL